MADAQRSDKNLKMRGRNRDTPELMQSEMIVFRCWPTGLCMHEQQLLQEEEQQQQQQAGKQLRAASSGGSGGGGSKAAASSCLLTCARLC
jgi:hypothetical protein